MAHPSRYLTTMPTSTPTPFAYCRRTIASVAFAAAAVLAMFMAPSHAAASVPHYEGVSADGSVVFFATTEKLAIGDTDSRRDVYERTFDPSVGESGDYVTREVSTGPTGGNAAFDAFFEGQ